MRRLTHGTSRGTGRLRQWWALPILAVAASAVAAGVVVGPTLGERVSIPRQLVLREPFATPTPTPTPTRTPPPRADTQSHPPTPPQQQTRVVTPRRPVVTSTNDDGHGSDTGPDVEGGDG